MTRSRSSCATACTSTPATGCAATRTSRSTRDASRCDRGNRDRGDDRLNVRWPGASARVTWKVRVAPARFTTTVTRVPGLSSRTAPVSSCAVSMTVESSRTMTSCGLMPAAPAGDVGLHVENRRRRGRSRGARRSRPSRRPTRRRLRGTRSRPAHPDPPRASSAWVPPRRSRSRTRCCWRRPVMRSRC